MSHSASLSECRCGSVVLTYRGQVYGPCANKDCSNIPLTTRKDLE